MTIEEVNRVLSNYDLSKAIAVRRLKNGYTNINYQIKTTKNNYLFRICADKTIPEILYEMKLMKELKKIKFPTAYPVLRKDGKFINDTEFGNVLIYQFAEGQKPDINKKTAGEIAAAIARLNSFKDWSRLKKKNLQNFKLCEENIKKFKSAKNKYPEIFDYFIEETNFLSKPIKVKVTQGLIHGDAFPDNTIFKDDNLVALLDFEEACTDNLLYDIGVAINGFCFVKNQLDPGLLKAFLEKYEKIRKIPSGEKRLLPYYIQWGAHAMICWHLTRLIVKKDLRKLKRAKYLMRRVEKLRKIPQSAFNLS